MRRVREIRTREVFRAAKLWTDRPIPATRSSDLFLTKPVAPTRSRSAIDPEWTAKKYARAAKPPSPAPAGGAPEVSGTTSHLFVWVCRSPTLMEPCVDA